MRPQFAIVAAKWLDNGRQVGTSDKMVKPKIYLVFGISRYFQHMGGLKAIPFFVAVNKNPRLLIFKAANGERRA